MAVSELRLEVLKANLDTEEALVQPAKAFSDMIMPELERHVGDRDSRRKVLELTAPLIGSLLVIDGKKPSDIEGSFKTAFDIACMAGEEGAYEFTDAQLGLIADAAEKHDTPRSRSLAVDCLSLQSGQLMPDNPRVESLDVRIKKIEARDEADDADDDADLVRIDVPNRPQP